ncbi:MAG: hypothetical protein ACEQR8_10815 [Cypionkella sp.]
MPGDIWSLLLILGPLVLLGVIVWAYARNKAAGRRNLEQAERGAARLREEIERDSR